MSWMSLSLKTKSIFTIRMFSTISANLISTSARTSTTWNSSQQCSTTTSTWTKGCLRECLIWLTWTMMERSPEKSWELSSDLMSPKKTFWTRWCRKLMLTKTELFPLKNSATFFLSDFLSQIIFMFLDLNLFASLIKSNLLTWVHKTKTSRKFSCFYSPSEVIGFCLCSRTV